MAGTELARVVGQHIMRALGTAGLTPTAAAALVGLEARQFKRYADGEQLPSLGTAIRIASALGMTLDQLTGREGAVWDLSGRWFAVWQTTRNGLPHTDRHELQAAHVHDQVRFDASGDYRWTGTFRLRRGALRGEYETTEADKHYQGAMFMPFNATGTAAMCQWAGSYHDGLMGHGLGAIARDAATADALMNVLLVIGDNPIPAWPELEALL